MFALVVIIWSRLKDPKRYASGDTLRTFRSKLVKQLLKTGKNARKRTLTLDEYVRLTQEAAPHLRDVLVVAFNTGMRAGELRILKWSYIDTDKGFIRLPAEVTKEDRDKNIPINHHVKEVLDSLPRALHHDFVFTYRGEPITEAKGWNKSFQRACGEAGIVYGRDVEGGLIFHDIRRTVKTNMVSAGVDKVYRDTILGHSLKGMDKHYVVPPEEDLHKAMDTYTPWLDHQFQFSDHFSDQVGVS